MRCLLLGALVALGSLALASPADAQSRQPVSGVVVDTTDIGLPGATVVLLHPTDSTVVSFAASRADGAFRVRPVPDGAYVLQITSVGYASYLAPIEVAGSPLDVGRIELAEAVDEIGQLVVRADRVPLVMRGDTIVYNTDAFQVPAGANVEELLRRLPGVEVDADGAITAQGETVDRVTVDGREFFGDDPTIATRNLEADAVESVEVFDQASDTAEFTGVEDGQEEKTINLALREDRKVGMFGNASGGVGGSAVADAGVRYNGKAMLNRFSPQTQLSVIANVNNVNEQSFGFRDYISFMGGMSGGMRIGGNGISVGDGPGSGFSTTASGGVNLSHEFGGGTQLQSSYFINRIVNEQDRTLLQQQAAGAELASLVNQSDDQESESFGHRLNLNLEHEIGEGHDLRLRANGRLSHADAGSQGFRETRDAQDLLENTSATLSASEGRDLGGDAALIYRRRFGGGRSVVGELHVNAGDTNQDGSLTSTNAFFQAGDLLTTEELEQLQEQRGSQLTTGQKVLFTQTLGRDRAAQVTAEHWVTNEDQDQRVLDASTGTPVLDDRLSSAFSRRHREMQAGLVLRDNREPYTLSAGLDVRHFILDGNLISLGTAIDRAYTNLLPSASVGYSFSQSRTTEVEYRAGIRDPSLRQLQPIVDNSNPLAIYVGNPDLNPEISHNLNARYFSFDAFTSTNLFVFGRASYTTSTISTSRTVDDLRRQTSTPVNVDGAWSVNGNVSLGTPVRQLGVKLDGTVGTSLSRTTELLNGEENDAQLARTSVSLSVNNRTKDLVDVEVGGRASFNRAAYSLNPDLDQSYVNRSVFGRLDVTPGLGWRLGTKLDVDFYAGGVLGGAQTVPRWQAELSKSVLNDRAQVELVAMDLLNRNVGVTYTNTAAYVQEERVRSLGRYVLLRFVYTLGGSGPGGGMQVMRIGG